jgi:hypothetical protein
VKWVYHVSGSRELEMTPVVKDGVMYIAQYNRVDAIDARSGNVIWRYQRPPASTAAYRGTSVYDNKVFVATTDAHLVALDARSGGVVWDVPVECRAAAVGHESLHSQRQADCGRSGSARRLYPGLRSQNRQVSMDLARHPAPEDPEYKTWSVIPRKAAARSG